jgi:hypothetical protein
MLSLKELSQVMVSGALVGFALRSRVVLKLASPSPTLPDFQIHEGSAAKA